MMPRATAATGTIAEPVSEAGRRRDRLLLLPPAVATILFAFCGEDFGFDPPGWIDSYAYLGYFWHYPDHAPWLDHDYKASRLAWILPGYVLHWLSGPVTASIVLAATTLALGGIALYLLVRDITEDRSAAAVIAAAWTACTWVHGHGGWNYHMLAATDYFLFASWLALRAGRTDAIPAAMGSGACAAAAVTTHLYFASFVPLLGLTYWSALPRLSPVFRRAVRDVAFGVAGGLCLTVALATINAATGGDWLFLNSQILQARRLLNHDDWWQPLGTWVAGATYLVLPAAFIVAGSLRVLRLRRHSVKRTVAVAVLQAWLALGLMCVSEFRWQLTTLSQSYFAFPIYLFAFPCAGVAIAGVWTGRSTLLSTAAVAVILAPLLLMLPELLPSAMNAAAGLVVPGVPLMGAVSLCALIAAVLTIATPGDLRMLVFAGSFSLLNAWIAPDASTYGRHLPGYRQELLELIAEADGFTAAFDPNLDGIRYWYTNEPVSTTSDARREYVFDTFVSTRGLQTNLLPRQAGVPLHDLTLEHLDRAVCIGLLTWPDASAQTEAAFLDHFASLGRPLRRVTMRHFRRPDLAFDLILVQPADAPARRGPPCLRQ